MASLPGTLHVQGGHWHTNIKRNLNICEKGSIRRPVDADRNVDVTDQKMKKDGV